MYISLRNLTNLSKSYFCIIFCKLSKTNQLVHWLCKWQLLSRTGACIRNIKCRSIYTRVYVYRDYNKKSTTLPTRLHLVKYKIWQQDPKATNCTNTMLRSQRPMLTLQYSVRYNKQTNKHTDSPCVQVPRPGMSSELTVNYTIWTSICLRYIEMLTTYYTATLPSLVKQTYTINPF